MIHRFVLFAVLFPSSWALIRFEDTAEQPSRLFPDEKTRLTLQCPLSAESARSPAVQIAWFHDGRRLERHSAALSIPSVASIDSGSYRCLASAEGLGSALSGPVNVSVNFLHGFGDEPEPEHFFRRRVVAGNSFILHPPRLKANVKMDDLLWKWTRDGKEIEAEQTVNFVSEASGNLVVTAADSARMGDYRVEVRKGDGTAFVSREIQVEEDLSVLPAEPAFAIIYRPRDVKVVRQESKSVGPAQFSSVFFECVPNLAHKYQVELRWFLNSEELFPNAQSVRFELGGRRLRIGNVFALVGQTMRSAVIRCEAKARTADGGQWLDQADARLDILEVPRIDRKVLGEQLQRDEGEQLRLECRTQRGWPRPKLSWYFNGQKIEDAHSETLVVSQLNARDFGIYQCEASNQAGLDISAVALLKRGATLIAAAEPAPDTSATTTPTGSGQLRLALIEKGPDNQSVLIGSNVQMPCRVNKAGGGHKAVWYKNDEEMPSEGDPFRRVSFDREGTLWISQVGPDSAGEYRCAARAANGEEREAKSAWLNIIEKPGMVQNVRAELVNGTIGGHQEERIRVLWTPGFDGNSPVAKWTVEVRTRTTTQSGFWSDWESSIDVFPQQQQHSPPSDCCSTFVENVRPSATAEFRVTAHNRFGAGKPSLASNNVTMPQQPPAAAPTKVHASARSSQSVMIQWQPPEGDDSGGGEEGESDIGGYVVRYRLSGYASADWNERNVSNGQARNALIEPLITWREYDVQVAAYNQRGLGVFSRPVQVTTLEGVPIAAPRNVRVEVLNSTHIRVGFDPPSQQMVPGVNLGYKLELWQGPAGGGAPVRVERLFPAFARVQEQIGGLVKFGRYNLTALCFTAPGDGPRSDPVQFQTAEDLPGPVQALEAAEVFSESALLHWGEPAEPNGIVQKYLLEWWETDKEGGTKRVELSGQQRNHSIEGLRSQTNYRCKVTAFTRVGAGPPVEAQFQSGVPPELPGKPSGLSVSEVGSRKARLSFAPGFDGHAPIKRWMVEARVGQSSAFSQLTQLASPSRGTNSLLVEGLRPHTEYQLRLVAENVRGRSQPSDPSRPFRTLQSVPEHPPHNLWADPVSASEVSLAWMPLIGGEWNGEEPRGYVIQYRTVGIGGVEEGREQIEQTKWEQVRIPGGAKQHQHLLKQLRPHRMHQLRILAENGVGRSEPGQTIDTFTYEGVPSAAPLMRAQLNAQGGIEVRWNELEPEQRNGQIVKYKVHLLPQTEDGEPLEREVSVQERRFALFPSAQLDPFTKYAVSVSAETVEGEGPAQEGHQMVVLETPERVPDAPENVSFVFKSSNELRLGWNNEQRHPKGRIQHYGVLMWRKGEPRPALPFTEVPSNLNVFMATQLRANSTYMFAIKSQSGAGWGEERVLAVKTSRHNAPLPIPPVPRRDNALAQSATEVHVIWDKMTDEEGEDCSPPRSVEMEWQRANEDEWHREGEPIPAERHRHTLKRLRPNTAYRLRLRYTGDLSRTSVWSSESDWLRTMEAPPAMPPPDVRLHLLDSTSVRVQWSHLERGKWNADRLGYRVHYRIYRPGAENVTLGVEEVPLMGGNSAGQEVEVVLRGLHSFQHYLVQVCSYNVLGESAPSRPPRHIFVGQVVPDQKVQELRAEPISSTALRVQWRGEGAEGKGQTSGYRLRWRANGDSDEEAEEFALTELNEHTIADLHKWTEYQISVSVYNRAGDGPPSTVSARTLEDLPGPVGQLQFRDIMLDSANVSWTAPSEPNGNLTGYVLLYRTQKVAGGVGLAELFPRKEVQLRTTGTQLHLGQLDEGVTYFVSVRPETTAGFGPETSANVTTGFSQGAPDAPSRPNLVPEQRCVVLRWRDEGAEGDSPIKGHLVQAKRVGVAEVPAREGAPEGLLERKKENADVVPRHVIGQWNTLGLHEDGTTEWRVFYRELEPSSYYVFRVFALNQRGIGRPSTASERLHVPASIPDEPFYAEWWFLALVGSVLSAVMVGFVVLLFLSTRNNKIDDNEKRKRGKKRGCRDSGGDAFDTLQLSDGGIVSYELCAKRSERGDLFSRPNTKQSWVGSIGGPRDSPATGTRCPTGMYGSLDGETPNGGGDVGGPMPPNMYSALSTDAMPLSGLGQHLLADKEGSLCSSNGHKAVRPHPSAPYYQLRQFNAATRLQPQEGNAYGTYGDFFPSEGGLPLSQIGDQGALATHYQRHQPERREVWQRTRERGLQQQQHFQSHRQQHCDVIVAPEQTTCPGRVRTPVSMFDRRDGNEQGTTAFGSVLASSTAALQQSSGESQRSSFGYEMVSNNNSGGVSSSFV